jgi:hypothetical protein
MRAITLALICAFLQAGKYTVRELRVACCTLAIIEIRSVHWWAPYLLEIEENSFVFAPRQKTNTRLSARKDSKLSNDVSVAAQRTPTISYISQEQIKDIGETVELQCSVQYAQEYPILWIKVNKENVHEQVALSTGTALIIRDSRFSLKYDTASTTYILQVGPSRRPSCRYAVECTSFGGARIQLWNNNKRTDANVSFVAYVIRLLHAGEKGEGIVEARTGRCV